ncbi:hypothetical protein SBA3_4990002 [Candidatus Sulfopaludibacter sp. SbA3]|nr:hypothetical protein SBA3_4990002 [Candidatus Sulfopaludibacter sp. SbA3]
MGHAQSHVQRGQRQPPELDQGPQRCLEIDTDSKIVIEHAQQMRRPVWVMDQNPRGGKDRYRQCGQEGVPAQGADAWELAAKPALQQGEQEKPHKPCDKFQHEQPVKWQLGNLVS